MMSDAPACRGTAFAIVLVMSYPTVDLYVQAEPAILAVGFPRLATTAVTDGFSICHVPNGRAAIELLRMIRYDLVLLSSVLSDMPALTLLRKVRTAWPQQKCALFGDNLSEQEEREARSLGVVAVLDGPPLYAQLWSLVESVCLPHSLQVRL